MLNLLPKEVKEKYNASTKAYSISVIYLIVVAILGLGAAGLATFNYMQQVDISNKQGDLQSLVSQQQKSSDITKQAAFLEDRLAASTKYQEKADWSPVLGTIASDIPTDVQLTSLKLTDSSNFELAGQTTNELSAILLKQRLASEKNFNNVTMTALTETKGDKGLVYTFNITFGVKK